MQRQRAPRSGRVRPHARLHRGGTAAEQQRVRPVEHRVRADPLAQRAHPAALIVGRHQQRGVQRVGERIDRERIDVDRVFELARGAGEFRQHQHAVLVAARGDEFLGDQVHAVVQRRHHAHVGGAIHGANGSGW